VPPATIGNLWSLNHLDSQCGRAEDVGSPWSASRPWAWIRAPGGDGRPRRAGVGL